MVSRVSRRPQLAARRFDSLRTQVPLAGRGESESSVVLLECSRAKLYRLVRRGLVAFLLLLACPPPFPLCTLCARRSRVGTRICSTCRVTPAAGKNAPLARTGAPSLAHVVGLRVGPSPPSSSYSCALTFCAPIPTERPLQYRLAAHSAHQSRRPCALVLLRFFASS